MIVITRSVKLLLIVLLLHARKYAIRLFSEIESEYSRNEQLHLSLGYLKRNTWTFNIRCTAGFHDISAIFFIDVVLLTKMKRNHWNPQKHRINPTVTELIRFNIVDTKK